MQFGGEGIMYASAAERASHRPTHGFSTAAGISKVKNFEMNEPLNYIVISKNYDVAKYACVMASYFAATTRTR
jgi:hypothetical protein